MKLIRLQVATVHWSSLLYLAGSQVQQIHSRYGNSAARHGAGCALLGGWWVITPIHQLLCCSACPSPYVTPPSWPPLGTLQELFVSCNRAKQIEEVCVFAKKECGSRGDVTHTGGYTQPLWKKDLHCVEGSVTPFSAYSVKHLGFPWIVWPSSLSTKHIWAAMEFSL